MTPIQTPISAVDDPLGIRAPLEDGRQPDSNVVSGGSAVEIAGKRVLVTDAHTTKSLAIVRALGRTMDVWTAADSRLALAAWSRYAGRHLRYPASIGEGLCDWLIEKCREHRIDLIITPEEWSSLLVARDSMRFRDEEILITTPPYKALQFAVDKAQTIAQAEALGIPTPPTAILERIADGVKAGSELGFPLVIKPRTSRYWDGERFASAGGVRYAKSESDLKAHLAAWPAGCPPPLLQRYVDGRGLGVFMLLDQNGRVCAEFAHERLRDVRSTGAASVLRRSVAMDQTLRERSLALLRSCRWSGVAMIEFRANDEQGEAYLMEINGRFWGSLQLAIDAGVNFPRALVEMTLGQEVRPTPYNEGVIARWWLGDLLGTLRTLKGRPRGYSGAMPGAWQAIRHFLGRQPAGTRNEVLRWDDPLPMIGEILGAMRRL